MRIYSRMLSLFLLLSLACAQVVPAQTVLTLQECRDLALKNNRESAIAREKVEAAGYDRKAARANYLPSVSATGAYLHTSNGISLLTPEDRMAISGAGTAAAGRLTELMAELMASPTVMQVLMSDPVLQQIAMQAPAEIENSLNAIGQSVADKFSFDLNNIYVGMVSVEEPLYVGGKIRAYNKVAAYAEELASAQLETEERKVLVTTDEAYWQIVSIAAKLALADKYVELLRKFHTDVEKMKNEGVATASDLLSVKVKLNEAEMTQLRASNGLTLSKMLLCQLCGLDLHSEIRLADEDNPGIVAVEDKLEYSLQDIDENRPELKSLQLATKMYGQKVNIVRADYLPALVLMGNYMMTNPNLKNGFDKSFSGAWNVSLVARIPLFHFGEGLNKVRHAKSDALIAQYQLDDVREKISLQVTQCEQKVSEADSRLEMTVRNMENAEENLRIANVGFREGVLEPNVVTQAQTAWMQARSEEIDARIDRVMADVYLRQATGIWNR